MYIVYYVTVNQKFRIDFIINYMIKKKALKGFLDTLEEKIHKEKYFSYNNQQMLAFSLWHFLYANIFSVSICIQNDPKSKADLLRQIWRMYFF